MPSTYVYPVSVQRRTQIFQNFLYAVASCYPEDIDDTPIDQIIRNHAKAFIIARKCGAIPDTPAPLWAVYADHPHGFQGIDLQELKEYAQGAIASSDESEDESESESEAESEDPINL